MPDKKVFLSFGFRVFLYILAGILVSNLLLYYTIDQSIGQTYYDTVVIFEVAKRTSMLFVFSVSSLIYAGAILLVFIASLVMSHRISGPMFRFMKCAASIAEGDLTVAAVLRDGDQFKPQAESLNAAVSSMRERVALVAARVEDVKQKSYVLEGAAGNGECSNDKACEVVKEMKAASGDIRDALSFFKIV